MESYGKSEVGTGDRPFLFDLFSLFSGSFCFVGFSLSSLLFFLLIINWDFQLRSGGMLDWLPMGLPRDTPLHPTYRGDELKTLSYFVVWVLLRVIHKFFREIFKFFFVERLCE